MAGQNSNSGDAARPLGSSLSERERQLMILAAQGLTDQGIAHKLGISLATVGTYWGRVRIKFGPLSRTELVAVYLREESSATINELKKANAELLARLEDSAKSEESLRASLEMFRGLIETAPDAIIVVGNNGKVEVANELAEDMFGYGYNELVGISIESLVPERYHEQHVKNREEYMENPVRKKMGEHLATVARRRDGTEFSIAASLSSTYTETGVFVTCLIRHLSESLGPTPEP